MSHCMQRRSGRKRSRSSEEEGDNSEAEEQNMPVDFHGIVNLAVRQSSVTWQAHAQSAQCRHFSILPVAVLYASAFAASVLHILYLGQDFAALLSAMRNVWLVVVDCPV